MALGRDAEAVVPFEAAVALDPSLTDLAVRVEVLKFRGAEQGLTRARDAAKAGRLDEAVQAYTSAIASSPDSPFLYRELAAVEKQKGERDAALAHFQKAVSLDPVDAKSLAQIGELLDARDDMAGAVKAYSDSLALESNADVARRLEDLRSRAALAALPDEFRAIDQAPQVTRADLAALIGIRLAPLLQANRRSDAALITDVRGNWAAALDHVGRACGGDGAVRQPCVSAENDRSTRRPRPGSRAAAGAGGAAEPRPRQSLGLRALEISRSRCRVIWPIRRRRLPSPRVS